MGGGVFFGFFLVKLDFDRLYALEYLLLFQDPGMIPFY